MTNNQLILISIIGFIIFLFSLEIKTFGGYTIIILLVAGIIFYFLSKEIIKLLEKKASIIWIIIIIIIGFLILTIFYGLNTILENKKKIDKDWPTYKCKPYIVPFAGWAIGPKGISASENFIDCMWSINKNFFDVLMAPFIKMFQLILDILKGLTGDIQNIRKMVNYMRESTEEIAKDVYQKIYDAYERIAFLFKSILKIFDKLFDVFKDLFDVLLYTFYTMASLWNGPIGGIAHFFCFDENTKINMNKGKKYIKNIKIDDILENKNKIKSILKFSSNNINMYNYKNIIVSGEHIILEDKKWIKIKDSNKSRKIEEYNKKNIYCLITEDSTIKINNEIFKDYNGTNNEKINENIYKLMRKYINKEEINGDINYENNNNGGQLISQGGEGISFLNYLDICFDENVEIKMMKDKNKKIKDVNIGDKTLYGKVLGKIEIKNENIKLYEYNDIITSGNTLIYNNKKWIPIYKLNESKLKDKKIKNKLWNIITEENKIMINNEIFRDYEIINNDEINNYIDEIILKNINN